MDIAEKKERIIASFRELFDKEMSYKKLGVTEEERVMLDMDTEFQNRIEFILIEERENIIRKYRNFSISENEQVAFKATEALGKILYPSFFEGLKEPGVNINIGGLTKEEEQRIHDEYSILLGGKENSASHKQHN